MWEGVTFGVLEFGAHDLDLEGVGGSDAPVNLGVHGEAGIAGGVNEAQGRRRRRFFIKGIFGQGVGSGDLRGQGGGRL